MIWYITFVNYDDFVRLTGTHYKDYVSERLTGTRSGDLCPLLLQFSWKILFYIITQNSLFLNENCVIILLCVKNETNSGGALVRSRCLL